MYLVDCDLELHSSHVLAEIKLLLNSEASLNVGEVKKLCLVI